MGQQPSTYRLWRRRQSRSAGPARAIIAKLRPGAPEAPLGATMDARRAARAPTGAAATLARLVENGHAAGVRPVFDQPGPVRSARSRAEFLVGAGPEDGARTRAVPTARSAGIVEIEVARGTSARRLAAHIARLQGVEYAFVPPVRALFGRRARAGRPDPLASRQWAHGAIRLRHARAAAGFRDASGLTVAVVDSGIDDGHPDLAAAITEYRNFLREPDRDYAGHGTHVAGIVAAAADNGLGIAGVCAARVLALKALPRDDDDFDAPAYYRALRYVIGRAQVLNLSLGGEKDPAEIDVLRDVIDAGVVVVAAMGNEYEEGNPIAYPAAMREVCAVGASDPLDQRAGFSNTGRHIDLVAPGVGILSTTPTYRYDGGARSYDAWDGTSMAAPHVAGAAALVLARHPASTPAQVIRRLTAAADRVGGAKKRGGAYGAGRLNCEKALR